MDDIPEKRPRIDDAVAVSAPQSASIMETPIQVAKEEPEEEEMPGGNLLEFISKNILGGSLFKLEDEKPAEKPLPGVIAVQQQPAAALFAEGDWSWHRNPAAAIRSGGTNKQTPVWKYFVYNKTENLSRCIIGDCTYSLKGPHTSTLACHLKKHPAEYAEFQKLKIEYTRERNGNSQYPPSPSGSSGGSSGGGSTGGGSVISAPKERERNGKTSGMNAIRGVGGLPTLLGSPSSLMGSPSSLIGSPLMPNLAQNPFPFLFNPPLLNPNIKCDGGIWREEGQKKWRKEERRQRELEHRLSLFLASARIPSTIVFDQFFRELMEAAQPKFTCPEEPLLMEQLMASHHSRLVSSIRSSLSCRRVCLLLDIVRLPHLDNDVIHSRLCVSAAYVSPQNSLEIVLLAIRAFDGESLKRTVEQVLEEYGIPMERVVRVVVEGKATEGNRFKKQMEPYTRSLHAALEHLIDTEPLFESLKKTLFATILTLVTHPGCLQSLTKTVGRSVNLPIGGSFLSLIQCVVPIREELSSVLSSTEVDITDTEWKQCECICSLFCRLSSHAEDTIDNVVPSIMQIMVSIEKGSDSLGALASTLKEEIKSRTLEILDVTHPSFDGSFLQATALNPQLAMLLDADQMSYAKHTIEATVQERIRREEKKNKGYLGVDSLLASVIDRRSSEGVDIPPNTSSLYPDLLQAAQQKKKNQEKNGTKNRYVEAVVHSYFEEVAHDGCESRTFTNTHLPPLAFWQCHAHRCPQLADLATELLSIPVTTPGADRLFGRGGPCDPLSLLVHAGRLERDTMIRFNRAHLPKQL